MNNEPVWVVSSLILADWAGITQRAIEKLVKEKVQFAPTRISRGKYNFFMFSQIYLNTIARQAKVKESEKESDEESLSPEFQRARYHRAAADEKEIKNKQTLGELASIEELKQFAFKIQGIYNSVINSFPGRVSSEITGEIESKYNMKLEAGFIHALLKKESKRARQITADRLQSFANSGSYEPVGGAASEPPVS